MLLLGSYSKSRAILNTSMLSTNSFFFVTEPTQCWS